MRHNLGSCAVDSTRRGRPPADEPATVIVTMRVKPTEWVDLRDLAHFNQQRVSAFLRTAINQAALDCRDNPVFRDT